MRDFFLIVCVVVIGAVGYGFYDARHEIELTKEVDVDVEPVSADRVYYDTMQYLNLAERDNIGVYLKVTWAQPINFRVKSIHIDGQLNNGKTGLESFSGYCARGSSTDLSIGNYTHSMAGTEANNDPVCFIRLKSQWPTPKLANGEADMPKVLSLRDYAENLQVNYVRYEVKGVNKPMRYVVWIEQKANEFVEWVSSPFKRTA